VVEAIRRVDPDTPLLLDGWFHASPAGLSYLETVEDKHVLYAFHFYEPWEYTTFRVNRGRYAYPDRMPAPAKGPQRWNADVLRDRISPVVRWARENGIPPRRVVAAEFCVDRRVGGADGRSPYLGRRGAGRGPREVQEARRQSPVADRH